jgi:Cu/Ag efflux pump CusA
MFGMLPLMIMPGVGSEIYRGLATVIVGGMGVSAIFTLVLFPSLLRLGEKSPKQPNQNNIADLHLEATLKISNK